VSPVETGVLYQLAADLVLAVHLLFLVFVVLGGLLIFLRPAWMLLHVPAASWGAYVELWGEGCPLTRLENQLLAKAGAEGYSESFVGHYLLAVIYPDGLTREVQIWLGVTVIVVNASIYGVWLANWLAKRLARRLGTADEPDASQRD
jgi:hypothetical protein